MTKTETTTTPFTGETLSAMTELMPLYGAQAIRFSAHDILAYQHQHINEAQELDSYKSALLAAGRLQWVLKHMRKRISGLFTYGETITLLNCYCGELFFTDQLHGIASDLCDDHGVEIDSYQETAIAPLVDKIRALGIVERLALADALEQVWYRCAKEQRSPQDVLSELGFGLAD